MSSTNKTDAITVLVVARNVRAVSDEHVATFCKLSTQVLSPCDGARSGALSSSNRSEEEPVPLGSSVSDSRVSEPEVVGVLAGIADQSLGTRRSPGF